MMLDNFGVILLVFFISKLFWNVIYPAIMEWRWHFDRSDRGAQSFNMMMGLEVVLLIIFSLWMGYGGSYFDSILIIFLGAFLIAISYALSVVVTRFIRNIS